jgi:hypothetical protein
VRSVRTKIAWEVWKIIRSSSWNFPKHRTLCGSKKRNRRSRRREMMSREGG